MVSFLRFIAIVLWQFRAVLQIRIFKFPFSYSCELFVCKREETSWSVFCDSMQSFFGNFSRFFKSGFLNFLSLNFASYLYVSAKKLDGQFSAMQCNCSLAISGGSSNQDF